MRRETQGTQAARRRIHDAASHMCRFDVPFLAAVAEIIEAAKDVRHYAAGSHHRGILGGWSVRCACGGGSWVEMDGEPTPLCPALQRALAVAEAYDPTGMTLPDENGSAA